MPIRQALDAVRAEVEERFEAMRREMEERFGAADAGRDEVFRPLPEPSGLDMPLAEALAGRRTERSFSDEPISDQVLSALLHAADGINRADGKRTTPSCMNWQEVDIYALKPNGIWRWIPERRGMLFCALDEPFEASRRALKLFRRAAALAEKDSASAGPYSFRTAFMDWLAELHSEEEKNVR